MNGVGQIQEPPFAKLLFADTRAAWFWLAVRLYVAWAWLEAGWGKLGTPAWTGDRAGTALAGFANGALQKTSGAHPDVQGWYAAFLESVVLPNASVFSYLVVVGELAVGAALVLGAFTGIAAFAGSFMNMNFLLAGTVSLNPIMLLCELLLILAWRVAGWYGLDRYLLPRLGTPWAPGSVFSGSTMGKARDPG
jgi:thiosulfate dehydrogenase [quinone] large subunit